MAGGGAVGIASGAFALALALALGSACSSPAPKTPRTHGPTDAAGGSDAAAGAVPAVGLRGAACTPSDTDLAGTCETGLVCMPQAPGGYCLSFCGPTGSACGDGGVCTESSRAGNLCLASCTADTDCRTDQGYICDPVWHACSLPGLLAIKPPACDGTAAPARGAFGRSERLSSSASPGIYNFEPSAVVLPDGGLVALYGTGTRLGEPNQLAVARIGADGTRTLDTPFPADHEDHFDPWLAVDKAGTIHAVWLGFDGGHAPERNMTVGHATSTDGGATWSTPGVALDVDTDCPEGALGCVDKPMIAIGPDVGAGGGKREVVYVAYFSEVTEGMRVRASRDGGTTWSPSVAAHPGAYGDLEVDAAGTVHIVAVEGGPGPALTSTDAKVSYASSTDGGKTFSSPVSVSADGEPIPFFFSNPTLAVDSTKKAKRLYVAYPTGTPDGAWDIRLATSTDNGATWSRITVNDDAHCASHMVPEIVVDPRTHKLHITWLDGRGGGRLAHAVCAPGGKTCSPSESISDQPFAAYSYLRQGAAWLGEYYGLALDPKRKLLHAIWTQPVLENGAAISRILHAQASL